MSFRADVVIVGAGPVGMWTAAQTKIRNPNLSVVLLEKHRVYQRAHTLQIDPSSLKGIPAHPELQHIAEAFKRKKLVPTKEIESKLKRLCQRLGILTSYRTVTEPKQLIRQFPNAKVIIGADGSHSVIHKKIFEHRYGQNQDLQYIAEVKYQVQGNGEHLKYFKGSYRTAKLAGAVITEHVGRINALKQTPVTVRIFIDKVTYDQMKQATFKNPYRLSHDLKKIDPALQEKIKLWLNAKVMLKNEKRVPGSEKITVTKLSTYAAEKVVTQKDGRHWCLVGDAAFGVPFFRSLNNGLLSGTKLAETLSEVFPKEYTSNQPIEAKKLEGYQFYVSWLSWYEIIVAKIKNFVLNLAETYIEWAGSLPFQVDKWSYSQSGQLNSQTFLRAS